MYCANKHIPIHIYHPSQWRKTLNFVQGSATKRDALKEQAADYVKSLGFEIENIDESEAICINLAAQKMI